MLCIFCLKEKPSSEEHVFPEAIGGTLIINRVCEGCNNNLGTQVDAPLVDHPLVILARSQFGIVGKRGHIPDAFSKVFGIGTLSTDPQQRIFVSMPPESGKPEVKILYKRTVTTLEDGTQKIQVVVDREDIPKIGTILQRERSRAGMQPLGQNDLEAEVDRIVGSCQGTIERPEVLYNFAIDLVAYKRGIVKIAYELAWYWLGDRFLEDPGAAKLRAAISQPVSVSEETDSHGVPGSTMLGGDSGPFSQLWKDTPNVHIGLAMRHNGSAITVAIRIFSAVSGVINVSNDASRYPEFGSPDKAGTFIEIDGNSGIVRQSTLADEMARLLRSGVTVDQPG
jgi:hypothetical protein